MPKVEMEMLIRNMPWLRLWDRALDLPKVQKLTGDQFKAWINLMMLANRQNDRGRLPTIDEIAFALRLPADTVIERIEALVQARLVDRRGNTLSMHDWETWQPPTKTNAQRSKEWRDEQKQRAHDERSDERCEERISSAPDKSIEDQTIENTDKPRGRAKAAKPPFVLPSWIPVNIWEEHRAVRKRKRGAMTPYADSLVVKELVKLREQGNDPIAVLNESIRSGWTGVFPLREDLKPKASPTLPLADFDPVEFERDNERRRQNFARQKAERESRKAP